jgi:hypothetical protein
MSPVICGFVLFDAAPAGGMNVFHVIDKKRGPIKWGVRKKKVWLNRKIGYEPFGALSGLRGVRARATT